MRTEQSISDSIKAASSARDLAAAINYLTAEVITSEVLKVKF